MPMTNLPTEGFSVVPDDFRMLAGDITRTTYNASNTLDLAVSFQCIDAGGSYDKTPFIPSDRECLTIRPQVNFPECWNGKDAYIDDNSHVSYPVDGNPEGGKCPDSHPSKIPHLFLEATYHPSEDTIGEGYEWYPGCFVLADGDNYGYSFHADWLNGFPSGFIVDTFNECYDAASDTISKTCAPIDEGRAKAAPRDCVSQGQVVNESVGQMMAIPALPGNNPEYNSSETSKPSSDSYTESASLVTVSDDTQGVCIQGTCYDYAGSDIVDPSAGTGATFTVSSSAVSATSSSSSTGSPTETLLSSSVSASSSSSTASSIPDPVLVTVPDESDDDEELVCEKRKKKRRVADW
ncbi:hypothetical protein B9479_006695 [Cryptococcus floricola]|uniref:DUF1996 domain-containing protein n=1 Tax=Cryptococcus floricola TaxID=2591691 RepID=A0A5D3AR15_9TREE|nr:hypothetical protein B9479_006695 [Cryptococcus floricola]